MSYHRGGLSISRLSDAGFHLKPPCRRSFAWISGAGDIDRDELFRTFNMGMGYAFVGPKTSISAITKIFPDARVVGQITEEPGIMLEGMAIS
jgi:phosphoribosylformylglycinamidine cyclo-ligase